MCSVLAEHLAVDLVSFGQGHGEEPPVLPRARDVRVHLIKKHGQLVSAAANGVRFRRVLGELLAREAHSARVVHDHGLWLQTNHAAAVAARRAKVPLIVSPRGMISSWALAFHGRRKRLAWTLYQARDLRSAHLIHATSMDEAEDARRLGLRNPVAVIPNGVDLPAEPARRLRQNAERTALFLSRIHPKKGVLELITAWGQVAPPNWKLVIAGPDEAGHRARAEELVGRLGLGSLIRFAGSVPNDEKWRLYGDADLFILPTFSENFGIVVAEALGTGLPVITTTGAPWRVLRDHRCGWWIEPGVQSLARAICDATALSDGDRQQLGARGKEYVTREFSWRTIGQRMAAVYEWLCRSGDAPTDVIRC